MKETERLADQLRQGLEGEAWHGPSLMELLNGVGYRDAAARPVSGGHSIWQLTLHLAATYGLVLRRISGDPSALTPEQDWPAVPEPSPNAWEEARHVLRELDSQLVDKFLAMPQEALDRPTHEGARYSLYQEVAGLVQHNAYHGGQIARIRKELAG